MPHLNASESSDTRALTDDVWRLVDFGDGSGGTNAGGGLTLDDDTGVITLPANAWWNIAFHVHVTGTTGNEVSLELGAAGETPPLAANDLLGRASGVINGDGDCFLSVYVRVYGDRIPDVTGYVKANIISGTATLVERTVDVVDLVPEAGDVVGRISRTSDSPSFTSTSVRVMSVRVPVKAGRSYAIVVTGEVEVSSASAATSQHELRSTTDDTEPTTSSPLVLGRTVTVHNPLQGVPTDVKIVGGFDAPKDGYLRVAVCSQRPLGSPTCTWKCGAAGQAMVLEVCDVGQPVAYDGTIYI